MLKNGGNIENKHKSWRRYGEEKVEMDVGGEMRYDYMCTLLSLKCLHVDAPLWDQTFSEKANLM